MNIFFAIFFAKTFTLKNLCKEKIVIDLFAGSGGFG